ncbi:MAG: GAF domain-containing SpoIIE family protein phosphatase, partial [Aquihabitans sp.]
WNERDAVRQTKALVWTGLDDAAYQRGVRDPEHLALLRALAPSRVMVVPLVARGRVLGLITLLDVGDSQERAPDDVALAEELASRAALALDNGLLYESRLRITRSLQAALLPPALPDAPGLLFAARYQVAEPAIEIGGDFYDVIELGDGAWGVVVGDVCGRGPDAAALTGVVRHSVRAAVVRARRPSRVLAQTNEAVLSQIDDSSFCTVAYLRVEVIEGVDNPIRVTAACAGHPRPVLVRADGQTEFLACGGLLLGVVPTLELVEAEVFLGPDDAVVLYTDGVTEARSGGDLFGDDRLLAALAGLAGSPASDMADGLLAAVHAYQCNEDDDVAIVVVQASPSPDLVA